MKQLEVMRTMTKLYLYSDGWSWGSIEKAINGHEKEGWAVRQIEQFAKSTWVVYEDNR